MRRPAVETLEGRQLMAVNVTGVQTAGAGNGITNVIVSFNAPMNPVSAQLSSNYAVVGLGHDGLYQTRDDHVVPIQSAIYDATTQSVSVMPTEGLSRTEAYYFFARGTPPTGLSGATGEFLDGNSDGVAGDDYVTILPPGSARPGYRPGDSGALEFGPAPYRIVTVLPDRAPRSFVPAPALRSHVPTIRYATPRVHPPAIVPGPVVRPHAPIAFTRHLYH